MRWTLPGCAALAVLAAMPALALPAAAPQPETRLRLHPVEALSGVLPLGVEWGLGYAPVLRGQTAEQEPVRDLRLYGQWGSARLELDHERLAVHSRERADPLQVSVRGFNSHAERFLVTPSGGLDDLSVTASYQLAGWRLWGAHHRYTTDARGAACGRQFDVGASLALRRLGRFTLKFADYRAEGSDAPRRHDSTRTGDSRKLWLQWQIGTLP